MTGAPGSALPGVPWSTPLGRQLLFSPQFVDASIATTNWGLKSSWRPSGVLQGTPGSADPGAPVIPTIYVNEALTHSIPPVVDAIELYNPNGTPANVGGWFLTDD